MSQVIDMYPAANGDLVSVSSLITEAEVDDKIAQIKSHACLISVLMAELFERKAWLTKGYPDWESFVKFTFDRSGSWSRKMIGELEVVRNIRLPPGETLAVKHAEQLAKLPAHAQEMAYDLALNYVGIADEKLTTKTLSASVEVVKEMLTADGAISLNGESIPVDMPTEHRVTALQTSLVEHINEAKKKAWEDIARHSAKTLLVAHGAMLQAGQGRVLVEVSWDQAEQFAAIRAGGNFDITLIVKEKANAVEPVAEASA
jgi:hypothetical protein